MNRLQRLLAAAGCAIASPACSGAPSAVRASGASLAAAFARGNPFDGATVYVDPDYVAKVEMTIQSVPSRALQLRKLEAFPTAVWIDSVAKVASVQRHLDEALVRQKQRGAPVLTVFVLYDLPERDCAALASSGELTIANDGEARYEREFIEPLAAQFRAHPSQRIAVVLEPDSLPNVATNTAVSKCAAAAPVYRHAIARAITHLTMQNVWLYLDAAHAGWLGWERNRAKIAAVYRDVLAEAGGMDRVRGFATNVSNYDTLHGGDLAGLEPSDPCPDEISYVERLAESLAAVGITGKGFLIDTSRNGRAGIRSKPGSWCNVSGAGLGERPRASPSPLVDAYSWIKPPGDSDGGSDPAAPGYDPSCSSVDSLSGAPKAGAWFPAALLQLVDNAMPPL